MPAGNEGTSEFTQILVAVGGMLGATLVSAFAAAKGWRKAGQESVDDERRIGEPLRAKPVIVERADLATIGDLPILIRELTPMLRDAVTIEKANAESLPRLLANQEELLRRVDRNEERTRQTAEGVDRLVQELTLEQREREREILLAARRGKHPNEG